MSRNLRLRKTLGHPIRREKKRKSRKLRIERQRARTAAAQ